MQQTRITMRDVAARAGVDTSTVSLALRDSHRLPEETRKRIQAAAAEIGYRINPYVSTLMRSRRHGRHPESAPLMGYLTSHPERSFWQQGLYLGRFFQGAQAEAERHGWQLKEFWLGDTEWNPRRLGKVMAYRGIDSVLIAPAGLRRDALKEFPWQYFHSVAIGRSLSNFSFNQVYPNYYSNVQQCIKACLERGYRRIGYTISQEHDQRLGYAQLAGALVAQHTQNQQLIFAPADFSGNTPLEKLAPWIRQQQIEVIITIYGEEEAVKALQGAGIRVPQDVAVVSLSVSPGASVSGMDERLELVSAKAVGMLLGRLPSAQPGEQPDPSELLVLGQWNEGTTLPYKGRKPASKRVTKRSAPKG